jgi:tetratricopeptide (TPR) repeat protein
MKFIVDIVLVFISYTFIELCIARKNLRIAETLFKIGEYYQAIEKYKKAYKSQKLGVEKRKWPIKCPNAIMQFRNLAGSIWYKNAIKRKPTNPKPCFTMPIVYWQPKNMMKPEPGT